MPSPQFDFESELRDRIESLVADLQALVGRAALKAVRDALATELRVVPLVPTRGGRLPERERMLMLASRGAVSETDVPLSLDAYERHAIVRALSENGNSTARAAAVLGRSPNALYTRMGILGLRRGDVGGRGASAALPDYLRLDGPVSFEAYERRALERALAEAGGDKRAAAKLIGMGKSTMYRRCELLGVGRTSSGPPTTHQVNAVTEDG